MVEIDVRPATPQRWADVRSVLGRRGSVNGCWCMFYREGWREGRGEANRRSLKRLIDRERAPGLLAYRGDTPVGWVSVAPREEFPRLERSRAGKRVDDLPVWSLVCFYVPPPYRGEGVARALVRGAIGYARRRGAERVEAYPVDDTSGPVGSDDAYHGLVTLLRSEGFEEVARRTPRRTVMRLRLG